MAQTEELDQTARRGLSSAASVERIIEAALGLFAERGYKTTIAEISEAAGVSRALLFHHFGSKEGIHRAVVDHASAEVAHTFDSSPGLTGLAALRAFLEARDHFFRRRPQVARLLMVLGAESLAAGRVRPALIEFQDRKLQLLTRCLSEAVEDGSLREDTKVDEVALLLASATDGDLRMWGISPEIRLIERTNNAILEVLRLLAPPSQIRP